MFLQTWVIVIVTGFIPLTAVHCFDNGYVGKQSFLPILLLILILFHLILVYANAFICLKYSCLMKSSIWASFYYLITLWLKQSNFHELSKRVAISNKHLRRICALSFEEMLLYIFLYIYFFLFLKIFLSLCNRLLLLVVFCVELITTL